MSADVAPAPDSINTESAQGAPVLDEMIHIWVVVSTREFRLATVELDMPDSDRPAPAVSIIDEQDRLVREFKPRNREHRTILVSWDGTDKNGASVSSGTYQVKVVWGNTIAHGSLQLEHRL
jgi:flagellar hook assembly protein FlgD